MGSGSGAGIVKLKYSSEHKSPTLSNIAHTNAPIRTLHERSLEMMWAGHIWHALKHRQPHTLSMCADPYHIVSKRFYSRRSDRITRAVAHMEEEH